MVLLSKQVPSLDQQYFPSPFKPIKPIKPCILNNNYYLYSPIIPVIDLSNPDAKTLLVKACEELGFFKVINYGVPMEFMTKLDTEAYKFFSLPQSEKERAGPSNPFGYGNRKTGPTGDVGLVEYLQQVLLRFFFLVGSSIVQDYILAVKKVACEVLELLAYGLRIEPRNVFSKLLKNEKSDSIFRLNHYPPCPELQALSGRNLIGFGEHTDPQIISVLRSDNTTGLQIVMKDGSWFSVPPDQNSFYINVGDSLQVMTNWRFRSVRQRVLANSLKSRLSMIFFGGPPLNKRIAPLPSLLADGEESSMYKEFTWSEYKKSAYNPRLADNRLVHFEKQQSAPPPPHAHVDDDVPLLSL